MAATTPQQQQQQQQPTPQQQPPTTAAQKLAAVNEQTWLSMGKIVHCYYYICYFLYSCVCVNLPASGNLAEMMADYDKATTCYESALRHNPYSINALTQIASLCRGREQFSRVRFFFLLFIIIIVVDFILHTLFTNTNTSFFFLTHFRQLSFLSASWPSKRTMARPGLHWVTVT